MKRSRLRYRVVELTRVGHEEIEAAINGVVGEGWSLERIDYVKEPGVRRPQMAFLYFTRDEEENDGNGD